jgi:WD40 repeat protein
MSHCLNPHCPKPENSVDARFCQNCGTELLLGDRYRAIRLIGQGGFGKTFLAEDEYRTTETQAATCVVKQFHPAGEANAPKAAELFEREAARLEQLEHPQIPKLYAYLEQDQRQYIIQEFIEGQTLADELAEHGTFSEPQIIDLLQDLLPVLQFVHWGGVIHRDIKPENIVRRRDNRLVLVDFGAAKYATTTALERTGTVIGSAEYTAPEQTRGKAIFASDIYSLGVTCLHLLTQMSPFDLFDVSEDTWIWRQYLVNETVSDRLAAILNKMVQNSLKERWRSPREVLLALNSDSAAPAPGQLLSLASPIDSKPLSTRIQGNWRCVRTLKGHEGKVYAIAFNPDGQILISGGGDNLIKLWHTSTGKEIRTHYPGWFSGHSNLISSVACSPDGKTFATGSWDKSVKLWDLQTGKSLQSFNEYPFVSNAIAFSPDGNLIASGSSDKTIKLWRVGDRNSPHILRGHNGLVNFVAFSPNGKILASSSFDKTVKLWDIANRQELRTLRGYANTINSISFSPNSRFLATGGWDCEIKLWNFWSGQHFRALVDQPNCPHPACISPDGQTLASASENHTIKIWNVYTGTQPQQLSGHSSWINGIAFSPDGKLLATCSSDKTIRLWRCD